MASHIRGNLTEEQLKRIEANRKRALERLQQKEKMLVNMCLHQLRKAPPPPRQKRLVLTVQLKH